MVVIMDRRKIQMVHQSHGRFQPWMRKGSGEDRRVDGFNAAQQSHAFTAELRQYLVDGPLVVLRLVRLPIAQVGRGERWRIRKIVIDASNPQWLKVQ